MAAHRARRIQLIVGFVLLSPLAPAVGRANAGDLHPYSPQLIVPTPVLRKKTCGDDTSVVCKRGVAILSPIESPDRCYVAVGGKPLCVRYYPDYCRQLKKGPRVGIPGNGVGYMTPPGIVENAPVEYEILPSESDTSAYGTYSGALQDEARLLRLGGFSDATDQTAEPNRQPDLLDQLEGCR